MFESYNALLIFYIRIIINIYIYIYIYICITIIYVKFLENIKKNKKKIWRWKKT